MTTPDLAQLMADFVSAEQHSNRAFEAHIEDRDALREAYAKHRFGSAYIDLSENDGSHVRDSIDLLRKGEGNIPTDVPYSEAALKAKATYQALDGEINRIDLARDALTQEFDINSLNIRNDRVFITKTIGDKHHQLEIPLEHFTPAGLLQYADHPILKDNLAVQGLLIDDLLKQVEYPPAGTAEGVVTQGLHSLEQMSPSTEGWLKRVSKGLKDMHWGKKTAIAGGAAAVIGGIGYWATREKADETKNTVEVQR